jgi:hypothetical protein
MPYSKTSLGGDQIQGALSVSPRGKRIVYLVVGLVIAVGVGLAVWSGLSHDKYATSANGCVAVTIASTTGGGPGVAGRPPAVRPGRADPREGLGYSSMMIVTGPSLTSVTFMSAPNWPVSVRAPRARSSSMTVCTSGSATGPGAALCQVGLRPLPVSA